jgi:hypothetical protein
MDSRIRVLRAFTRICATAAIIPKQEIITDMEPKGLRSAKNGERTHRRFYEWALANGYQDDLQIDRRKDDLGYSPDNCRWVTHREQQSNRGK